MGRTIYILRLKLANVSLITKDICTYISLKDVSGYFEDIFVANIILRRHSGNEYFSDVRICHVFNKSTSRKCA